METPGLIRPATRQLCAVRDGTGGKSSAGNQTSTWGGNSVTAAKTPITSKLRFPKRSAVPSRLLRSPRYRFQKPKLTTAISLLSASESDEKRRPSAGVTPRTRKKSPETEAAFVRTG